MVVGRALRAAAAVVTMARWAFVAAATLAWLLGARCEEAEWSLRRMACDKGVEVDKSVDVADEPALLFIHVFKAAGSTVRELFRKYAERCGKRWACLVQCSNGGAVADGKDVVPCRLRDVINVNRKSVVEVNERQTGARRLRRNPSAAGLGRAAHVIGGHYHYGLHEILPPARPYSYFTVLREPLATWISGLRYNFKGLDTVPKLKAAMVEKMGPGGSHHYANALTYLIEGPKSRKASAAKKLSIALENLEHIAVVGVVESWQTTVDLLASLLDRDGAGKDLFTRAKRGGKRSNKARTDVSPRDVVASLKDDEAGGLWETCARYLRAENALYVAALKKHAAACSAVLGAQCRLRFQGGLLPLLNASLLEMPLLDQGALAEAAGLNAPGR